VTLLLTVPSRWDSGVVYWVGAWYSLVVVAEEKEVGSGGGGGGGGGGAMVLTCCGIARYGGDAVASDGGVKNRTR
jgi:hypothetical protein